MTQITARLPDQLVAAIDEAAARLNRSRADVVRRAIEYYLEDSEDLKLALASLQDPADPVFDWEAVRSELLDPDQG
jgi:transposase